MKAIEIFRQLARYTPTYRYAQRFLSRPYSVELLDNALRTAIHNTPYYKKRSYEQYLQEDYTLSDLPIIRKRDIIGHEQELIPNDCVRFFTRKVKTGGTTGKSMILHYPLSLSTWRIAYPELIYGKYLGNNAKFAILRGFKPAKGRLWDQISSSRTIFSSYQLSRVNAALYAKEIKDTRINAIMAYPSSIVVFAHYIRDLNLIDCVSNIMTIVVSSEICSRDDKIFLKQVFPHATILDYYCMAEQVATAFAVDNGNFEFNNNFGFVEFIDTGNKTSSGNKICEIVGTSVLNCSTMPLIRYATDDYAEIDENGSVISIIGRTSDFVVNKNDSLSPCTVVFSKKPMLKLLQFQYYQDTAGRLEFHVIPRGEDFTETDRQILIQDMNSSFTGAVDCDVVIVDSLEHTAIGKLRRMVQKLDINKYK